MNLSRNHLRRRARQSVLEFAPERSWQYVFEVLVHDGWRLGWMVVPEHLVDTIGAGSPRTFSWCPRLSRNTWRSPPWRSYGTRPSRRKLFSQPADADRCRSSGSALRDSRRPRCVLSLCRRRHLTGDSLAWCRELLDATGVALNTGRDFDGVHGDRFIRISFAVSTAETIRAIESLDSWLRKRKRA